MNKKIYLTEILLLIKCRNPKDFIDWIEYHLKLKFNHIVVLDNESPFDIKSICEKYNLEYHYIEGFPNQYKLYNEYVNNSKSWWVLPIDDDEYLYMKNFNDVNDMILYYQDKWEDMNKLSIRWKNMFPENANDERGEKSLLEFCTNSNEKWAKLFDGGNKPIKTFVKTTQKIFYDLPNKHTHVPVTTETKDDAYMCNGERINCNWYFGPDTDDDLKILHFQYKSKDEWIWKCKNRKRVSMVDKIGYNLHRADIYKKMI